eukprot:TRINITY_DN44415_c0_g1_i1.p1 TRINITY_DN44415_c0_g1~~TRINITY_DN44415_c0_g1_i1.p1  ORF type:complete len:335 (-),score=69.13 TRINITY_DN44415_c0_g1_i1:36-1040(-)
MGSSQSTEEPVVERPPERPPGLVVTVLGVSGDVLLDAHTVDRDEAVKHLHQELLKLKKDDLPHSVTLVYNGVELKQADQFPADTEEVEVTAVFKLLELLDAERKINISCLQRAGFGPTVGQEFRSFSRVARADRELVLEAVRCDPGSLKYADTALRNDFEFMRQIIKRHPMCFSFAGDAIKSDREIAMRAVDAYWLNFIYVAAALKDDEEIVRLAIKYDPMLLRHVSNNLKNNKEIVKLAVARNREAMKFAPTALQNDEDVRAAMKPEREKTEMEKAMDAQKVVDEANRFRQQAAPASDWGTQYRPTTALDRMHISMHNSSCDGLPFSAGLSGY